MLMENSPLLKCKSGHLVIKVEVDPILPSLRVSISAFWFTFDTIVYLDWLQSPVTKYFSRNPV